MKVLEVMGSLHRGGAETMIMNYYRAFDKSLCQMDFAVHAETEGDFREEAKSMGAKIIVLPKAGDVGMVKYIKLLSDAIKKNGPYDAVHAHYDYQDFLAVIAARKAGVKRIVVHSHTTAFKTSKKLINRLVFATNNVIRIACGEKAGDAFFGKGKYMVLANAIDSAKFKMAGEKELKNDKFVIGHLGRFIPDKNHEFIVSLAECLKERNLNVEFHLYGEGETLDEIKENVKKKNLETSVKFMGITKNSAEAYHTFDVFILPSLREGVPLVLVEAQFSEIQTLASDRITRECDLKAGLIEYLELDVNLWAKRIEEIALNKSFKQNVDFDNAKAKYDVNIQWRNLLSVYEGKLK